jgi:DNA-binding NarL/FixJ family response regulator
MRVLVVDDHPAFRAAARRLVEAAGMRVVGEAVTAAAAVDAARDVRPDLILLDVRLPDGDGFEVARELRRSEVDTVTVLISSRSEPNYPELARAAGAAGFLGKSELSSRTLVEVVAPWCP